MATMYWAMPNGSAAFSAAKRASSAATASPAARMIRI